MRQNFIKNSSISRNFWVEDIRYKLSLHRWIKFDPITEEVTLDCGVYAKYRILIAVFPLLFLSGLNLHYLYTKQSLDMFELLSIASILTMIAILLHAILREEDVRRTLYDSIYHLELADKFLLKFFGYRKRNYFVNHLNLFISITLLVYNALGLPAMFFFFMYPSTKVVDLMILAAFQFWPAVVYTVLIRHLFCDRLSIFGEVVLGLTKQKIDKMTTRKVASIFVIFKLLVNCTIILDKIIHVPCFTFQCIFGTALTVLFLSQYTGPPVEMHPFGIYFCIYILLHHTLVPLMYYICTATIGTEVTNLARALHKLHYKCDNKEFRSFLICMSQELSNPKYSKFKLADTVEVNCGGFLAIWDSMGQMAVLLLNFKM